MAENTGKGRVKYIGKEKDKWYYPDRVLGRGSYGTKVYEGFFLTKNAAVKKIPKDPALEFAKREINIFWDDKAPLENVVTCYWASLGENPGDKNIYLILERCAATLEDFIGKKYTDPMPNDRQVLYQICNGIYSIHFRGIAHKDLRPQNILISMPNDHDQVTMKIADFGLSRQTLNTEVTNTGTKGALGWLAHEIATVTPKVNYLKADIFSLGCILYYFITRGQHPFGQVHYKRQSNIVKNKKTIDTKIIDHTSASIIETMIEQDPAKRPSIDQVLQHPFLWPSERTIKFLWDTSNYLEPSKNKDAAADRVQLAADLENGSQGITGGNWLEKLSPSIQDDVKKYVKKHKILNKDPDYFNKVLGLLRIIRNMRSHFHDLGVDVRNELGANDDKFCEYWTGRFPKLLLHTWNVMKKCSSSDQFREFYQRLTLETSSSTTGTPVSNQPSASSVNVSADAPSASLNASIKEHESDVKAAPDANSDDLAARGENAAEVQRAEDPEDKDVLGAVPYDSSRAELVPRLTVLRELHVKKVGKSGVRIVASNPVSWREAAVSLKDGSIVFCRLESEPVTIQGPTIGFLSTSAFVWNSSGTWLAARDYYGRVLLWNRETGDTKTANIPVMKVFSMHWCNFKGKDVIQIVSGDRFCAMDTKTDTVGEFRFPQKCWVCSDWNGDDRFAVSEEVTKAINLYQVNLHEEEPLTLLTRLSGFLLDRVTSIRWNPADPNWIAVGYYPGHIRVWNIAEKSTPQFEEFSASASLVRRIEWMNSGAGIPEMLASYYSAGTVKIFTRRNNWECVKTIENVVRMKYFPLLKALFVKNSNNELRMINAELEERLIHKASSIVTDFDLSCIEERKFYAVIGDEDGNVTYVGMEIQS